MAIALYEGAAGHVLNVAHFEDRAADQQARPYGEVLLREV